MDFLKEAVSSFSSGKHSQSNPPPQPPPPWIVEWDGREERWIFFNQQTGERTNQFPQYGGGAGYGGGGYGGGQQYQGGGYGGQQYQGGGYGGGGYEGEYRQEEKKSGGHGLAYGAMGAAAGLAGGALLMHEGEEVKDDWDRDKYRAEQDVDNFPQNAAQFAGRTEQDFDNIPGDVDRWGQRQENRVEGDWDQGVQDVEDFPENAARWTGEKVQDVEDIPEDIEGAVERPFDDVERFGDRMDNAYDQGQSEGRNDDW